MYHFCNIYFPILLKKHNFNCIAVFDLTFDLCSKSRSRSNVEGWSEGEEMPYYFTVIYFKISYQLRLYFF